MKRDIERSTLARCATVLLSTVVFSSVVLAGLSPPASASDSLTILKPVGFKKDAIIRDKVKAECRVQEKLPDFIAQYAKNDFSDISFAESLDSKAPGKTLFVEVIDISEAGNAFTGRSKGMSIRGELREGGELVGSFRARRDTMGGFMGGFKGSCSFIGRCAKALGKDVAKWLKNPGMDDVLQ